MKPGWQIAFPGEGIREGWKIFRSVSFDRLGEVIPYPDGRQVQPHQFQVDDIVQDYSRAIPAFQRYAVLILEPGDTPGC